MLAWIEVENIKTGGYAKIIDVSSDSVLGQEAILADVLRKTDLSVYTVTLHSPEDKPAIKSPRP